MPGKERLVIVGCGMAGGKLVEELLSQDPEKYDISIIGDEKEGNYNRIKLVYKLQLDDVPEFELQSPSWFKDNGVNALLGKKVTEIDKNAQEIKLDDGSSLCYDKLVLATGSLPFIPKMKGLDYPGIMALRTIEDVYEARELLAHKSDVLVIGGGLLGLELAIGLKNMGKKVTVSHLLESLMELQLSQQAGNYLQRKLESKGIRFIMNNYVTEFKGDKNGVKEALFAKDMISLPTEAVFISTGIKPNTELAENTGIRTAKGIVVDDLLKTNDSNIFAIGECIEHRGKTYGLVAPVWEQARTLAKILNSQEAFYEGSEIPPTKLKSTIPVYTMGHFKSETGDEIIRYEDPHALVYKKLLIRNDKIIGANIVGDELNVDVIGMHYTANLSVPDKISDLLFPGAQPDESMMDASVWPDNASVCDCNGVSAGVVRSAISEGADTLTKVMGKTRAGTGCGNCKSKLKALLVSELGELKDDPAERYYAPGIPMEREELTSHIEKKKLKSVTDVLNSFDKTVKDDAKTRMALDYLLAYIWKEKYQVETESRFANDRYSANIQKDGRFSVIPRIHGGIAEPNFLENIAKVARKYNATIKITGADRIGLFSVEKKDLKDIWKQLEMDCGHAFAKSFRAAKSCVGSEFCRFGLGDSMKLGEMMDDRYRGTRGPAKFKMGASGCPRNCAEATIKDFGAVAVEEGWDVYVGGNAGARVIPAINIARVKTKEEVLKIGDRFYEYYRKHGRYHERAAYFIERVGLETVLDAILYDTEENLKKLDEDFQTALDNYLDPWIHEAPDTNQSQLDTPTSTQFTYLCEEKDLLPGMSQEIQLKDRKVAVFHTRDGKWITTAAECPHEQGPIVDAIYGGGRLACPIHAFSFDIETGQSNSEEVDSLTIFKTEVKDGKVSALLK